MEEVFQNYKNYIEWMQKNWEVSRELDILIVKKNLVAERNYNCNGEPYRYLTQEEFLKMQEINYITIPTVQLTSF